MNRARIVTFGIAGAIAVASAAVGVGVAHLKAFNPQPDPPRFGMVGIAEGQTARLNLVNLLSPGAATIPPGPCRAELQFLDGDGNVVASRLVRLEAGHAAFLDFAPTFVPVNTRRRRRAVARGDPRQRGTRGRWTPTWPMSRDTRDFRQRDGADDGLRGIRSSRVSGHCARCPARSMCRRQSGPQRAIAVAGHKEASMNRARIVTFGLAGATAVAFAAIGVGVAHLKAFNPQPDPPRFGMVGIAEGQTARLNLVNLIPPGPPDVPAGSMSRGLAVPRR